MALEDFSGKGKTKFPPKRVFLFSTFLILLVLFSPLPNLLAQPLEITPQVEKADALLVLSGGSYDNGQPSAFSLERTVQAVRLYRQNLAPKIIFSGKGNKGQKAESEDMAELAFSLGVDKNNVLIEKDSNSTSENILFSSRIAKQEKFNKILLVTSPIHMYRSLKIAQRICPEIEFLPASFPSYDSFRRHPLDRLILFWFTVREYLAILRESF